jgi:YfiH family protein
MLFKKTTIPIPPHPFPNEADQLLEIPYFEFPGLLRFPALKHAVFTRRGGVSPAPFASLNCSLATRDHPANVRPNLAIVSQTLQSRHLLFLEQVHSAETVLVGDQDLPRTAPLAKADGLLTNLTQTGLLIKQADCQAVILYDPVKQVIANVHCGWRGNQKNILGAAVQKMQAEFGSSAAEIRAAIGPSLGPCCAEFRSWPEIFPPEFEHFMVRPDYFDLWAVSRWQLRQAGLKEQHIETAGLCTKCRTDLFFSYRGGDAGRFATVVMLI